MSLPLVPDCAPSKDGPLLRPYEFFVDALSLAQTRRVAMVTGPEDLTAAEFDEHFKEQIHEALERSETLLVTDEPGTGQRTLDFLFGEQNVEEMMVWYPDLPNRVIIFAARGANVEVWKSRGCAQVIGPGDFILRPSEDSTTEAQLPTVTPTNPRVEARRAIFKLADKHIGRHEAMTWNSDHDIIWMRPPIESVADLQGRHAESMVELDLARRVAMDQVWSSNASSLRFASTNDPWDETPLPRRSQFGNSVPEHWPGDGWTILPQPPAIVPTWQRKRSQPILPQPPVIVSCCRKKRGWCVLAAIEAGLVRVE